MTYSDLSLWPCLRSLVISFTDREPHEFSHNVGNYSARRGQTVGRGITRWRYPNYHSDRAEGRSYTMNISKPIKFQMNVLKEDVGDRNHWHEVPKLISSSGMR